MFKNKIVNAFCVFCGIPTNFPFSLGRSMLKEPIQIVYINR